MAARRPPIVPILLALFVALELYHHRYGVMARVHNLFNVRPAGKTVLEAGQPLPVVQLTNLAGESLSITPKPGHVLYVNVFATWCPECQKETPALQQLASSAGALRVDVVGIDQGEELGPVSAFVQRYGLTYPVFLDDRGITNELMGVRYIPTSLIVDRHGIVRARITGAITLSQMQWAVQTVLRGGTIASNEP